MSNALPPWADDDQDPFVESALPPKSGRIKPAKKAETRKTETSPLSLPWIVAIAFGSLLALTGLGFGVRHLYIQAQEKNRVAKAEADRIESEAIRLEQAKAIKLEQEKAAAKAAQDGILTDKAAAARKKLADNEQAEAARAVAEAEAQRIAAKDEMEAMAAGKLERARLLSDLDPAVAAQLKVFDDKIAIEDQNILELQAQINKISKNAARFPKAAARVVELNAELQSSVAQKKSLSDERAAFVDRSEQTRRAILARFPLEGDPILIGLDGRWLTENEHAAVIELQKAAERRSNMRANGQRLADWVWSSLSTDYSFEFRAKRVIAVSDIGSRFVDPQLPSVYSLTDSETSVTIQPLFRDNGLDDTFVFEVTFINGLGRSVQENGFVEIGYDNSGRAGLLGVPAPFLNNPLDGRLAATRSVFEKAMGKAYGF